MKTVLIFLVSTASLTKKKKKNSEVLKRKRNGEKGMNGSRRKNRDNISSKKWYPLYT